MSDIALLWDETALAADLGIEDNDLALDGGLRTAVLISLFTDLGWWADEFSTLLNDRIGSRLHELARAKPIQSTLDDAEQFAREALQWLIDTKVADSVTATASFTDDRKGWLLEIFIPRPAKDPATFRFNSVWIAEQSRTS